MTNEREDTAKAYVASLRHDKADMCAECAVKSLDEPLCKADEYLASLYACLHVLHEAYPHTRDVPLRPRNPRDLWPDGTPIWRGPPFPEPWGNHPRDRWVRVMADISADGVWDVSGAGGSCDELPISDALVARIRAWQEWHDALDVEYWLKPEGRGAGGSYHYWEQHPDAPVAAFDAEAAAIGEALRAELPPDWTVIVTELAAWCRDPTDESEGTQG